MVKQMRELKARMSLNSFRKVVKELEFLILGISLVLQNFFPNLNFDDQEPISNKAKVFPFLVNKKCRLLLENVQEFIN